MAWIELHQSLFTHRKTMQVADTLNLPDVYVVAHLAALWTWALDNAPSGKLPPSHRIIAKAAQWPGNPNEFVNALFDARFLEVDEDGETIIYDWSSYAGRLVEKREANAERMRRARAERQSPPQKNTHNAPESTNDECATHVQSTNDARAGATVPYRTVPNQTKEEDPPYPPNGGEVSAPKNALSERFEAWYQAYPKKRARGEAEKVWARLKPSADLLAAMLKTLEWQVLSPDWTKEGGKFIPYPATYLNSKGWEDQPGINCLHAPVAFASVVKEYVPHHLRGDAT